MLLPNLLREYICNVNIVFVAVVIQGHMSRWP